MSGHKAQQSNGKLLSSKGNNNEEEGRKEGRSSESDENKRPEQNSGVPEIQIKKRISDSGVPTSRRHSAGGTPTAAAQPRLPGPRVSPRIQPRETRSSLLRKSLSGSESNFLSSPASASKDSGSGSMGLELQRLRDDLRVKERQNDVLDEEAATLRSSILAKDRALSRLKSEAETAKEKLTHAEGDLANKARELKNMETEKGKLQAQIQSLEREADKLHRKLNAAPKVSPLQGPGLSEAVATLEAEVKALKAENGRLEDDSKGVYNQLRAKDKEMDNMAQEVERARSIHIQNQELDNYMLDLRRQLQEASNERATLLNVQRQNRADILGMAEAKEAAEKEAEALRQELTSCRIQLKGSQDNAQEVGRELDLQRTQLTRVSNVASRAAVREVGSLKEEGTVPYAIYKDEVMHLKGENDRIKDKLRLSEKSAAATQQQIQKLYQQLDSLKDKA